MIERAAVADEPAVRGAESARKESAAAPRSNKQAPKRRSPPGEAAGIRLLESNQARVRLAALASGQNEIPISSETAETIRSPGPGSSMSAGVRNRIEPHVGVDLSSSRVHEGPGANKAASNLGARAFTHGSDIFLGRGESSHDVNLMAHEATHVAQQTGGVKRMASVSPDHVQLWSVPIPDFAIDAIRAIPGYEMVTLIFGFDPLSGSDVERSPERLVVAVIGMVPFGEDVVARLRDLEVIQRAGTIVEEALDRSDLSIAMVERLIDEATDEIEFGLDVIDQATSVVSRKLATLISAITVLAESLTDSVVEIISEAAVDFVEEYLADTDAWALLKKILGEDPLTGEPVEATTAEMLQDFLLLIGKEEELRQMQERGTLERTAEWLDANIGEVRSLIQQLIDLVDQAWEAIQPENLPDLIPNLESLGEQAIGFGQNVLDFAWRVATTVLEFIKDSLLGLLSEHAHEILGFELITVLLGQNPFTGEAVPRTPENIIRGFFSLVPGGLEQYDELAEAGVIGEAAATIESAVADLGITWEYVQGLFIDIWNSVSIEDLIDPIGTFEEIVDRFGEPISRVISFVQVVVGEVIKLVLALMNAPTDILEQILTNAMSAFEDIKNDPVGFLENMLLAVKQGFTSFFDNVVDYLLGGLVDWLFRGLRDAGIEPPTEITLESILDLILQVLGLSVENLWEKLAEHIGQENVDRIRGAIDRLVGIWEFIKDVQERGIAAIWEYIESKISDLWDMVLEQAMEWITEKIITRVTTKLLSMLDPTGVMAVVNSFIAFFNAVQSAIEYIREILEIVNEYAATMAAVAKGDVEPGAAKLEEGLASSIPVAIGFLANQVGLGNIAEKISEIIEGVRDVVDQALDWLMEQAVSVGASFLTALGVGEAEGEQELADGQAAETGAEVAPGEEGEGVAEEAPDPTDHVAVVGSAVSSLESLEEGPSSTAPTLVERAENLARRLEQHWTPKLEDGVSLAIAIERADATADSAGRIDYVVSVGPNTETESGSISRQTTSVESEFFTSIAELPAQKAASLEALFESASSSQRSTVLAILNQYLAGLSHIPGVQPHSQAPIVRQAFEILYDAPALQEGMMYPSAHLVAKVFGESISGYRYSGATTAVMDLQSHNQLDNSWKRWRNQEKSKTDPETGAPKTHVRAGEIREVMSTAFDQLDAYDQAQRNALWSSFDAEFLGLINGNLDQLVPIVRPPDLAQGSVNLNTAGYSLLVQLPHIGPVRADAIIEDREEHDPYTSISDLERVHGIGPKTVERLLSDGFATV